MQPMIHLKNCQFSYPGNSQPVLNIKDLQISNGEKIFLYGPSGTGKTTLLEILAGILVPQSGEVFLAGQVISKMSSSERDHFRAQNIGYVFQSFNLVPYLTVQENILLPFELHDFLRRGKSMADIHAEMTDLCQRLGLLNLISKNVTELSVGQQQRVAVARSLIQHPQIILADEPTSALDYDHREKFLKILFDLAREKKCTIVFVSHDRTMEKLFDRSLALAEISDISARAVPGSDV